MTCLFELNDFKETLKRDFRKKACGKVSKVPNSDPCGMSRSNMILRHIVVLRLLLSTVQLSIGLG